MVNIDQIKNTLYASLINEDTITIKKQLNEFVKTISSSEPLLYEYHIFKNLKNTTLIDKTIIKDCILENLSFLSKFTKKRIITEHKKLKVYSNGIKDTLSDNIHSLIEFTINGITPKNVNKYNTILNETIEIIFENNVVKTTVRVNQLPEILTISEIPSDKLFEFVLKKYNTKYTLLSEQQKNIIKTLSNGTTDEQVTLFEECKVKAIKNASTIEASDDLINECVNKIKNMSFNNETIIDDIIKLNELA